MVQLGVRSEHAKLAAQRIEAGAGVAQAEQADHHAPQVAQGRMTA